MKFVSSLNQSNRYFALLIGCGNTLAWVLCTRLKNNLQILSINMNLKKFQTLENLSLKIFIKSVLCRYFKGSNKMYPYSCEQSSREENTIKGC